MGGHLDIAGRVPPHDLDAEASVLSASMLDAEARDAALALLRPEHFYSEANSKIWTSVVALAQAASPIDVVTVANWLRSHGHIETVGGAKYLGQIVDSTPAIANVSEHARIVWRKWRRRRAIAVMHRLLAAGYSFDQDDEDFMTELDRQITEVLSETFSAAGPRHIQQVLVESMQQIKEAQDHGPGHDAVPTPVHSLTMQLDGGPRGGDLVTIAARPGMGKSALVDQWMRHAATPRDMGLHGWTVGFSLEMPGVQKGTRLLASEAGVDLRRLRTGLLESGAWSRVTQAGQDLARLPIYIDDEPASPIRVAAASRKLARQAERAGSRLVMVVVDYLQILQLPPSETRERAVADATIAFKALAKELGCPVVQLAQLNRSVESQKEPRPGLSHLRESGAIEQDSDIIIFIYRPEYYDKDNPSIRGIAELIVAKQRNGQTGTVECRWDGPRTRFLDADEAGRRDVPPDDNWQEYNRIAEEAGL